MSSFSCTKRMPKVLIIPKMIPLTRKQPRRTSQAQQPPSGCWGCWCFSLAGAAPSPISGVSALLSMSVLPVLSPLTLVFIWNVSGAGEWESWHWVCWVLVTGGNLSCPSSTPGGTYTRHLGANIKHFRRNGNQNNCFVSLSTISQQLTDITTITFYKQDFVVNLVLNQSGRLFTFCAATNATECEDLFWLLSCSCCQMKMQDVSDRAE